MYANEIAPAVLEERILQDLVLTALPHQQQPNWNLSQAIRCRDQHAGLPTLNLLGYHTSEQLTDNQIRNLAVCGIVYEPGQPVFRPSEQNHVYQSWRLNIELLE